MKILSITPSFSEIIETNDPCHPTYRRHGPDDWEKLMGESWNPVFGTAELEAAYREVKKDEAS